jgi:protein TonB
MIDFAPVPLAPEAPPQDVAVGPQMTMAQQSAPSELSEDTPTEETEQTQETAAAQTLKEPPRPEVETITDVPELPVLDEAEAVLAQASRPPVEIEAKEDRPPNPKPKPKPKASSKPQEESDSSAPATSAPKPLKAHRANTNLAPSPGVSSSMSAATWRGRVMAHLNARKRYPGGGARGTSSIAFVIDRSGRVLSARLIRSSGSAALDREAVALARRSSPVPAPPPNVRGGRLTLTVPIRFSR